MSTDGYVYVLEISTGRVKVGFTANLKARLAAHRGTAKAYGAEITRTWTSPLHREARPNETVLLNFCRSLDGVDREGEYFAGVSYDDVVAFAETELSITEVRLDESDGVRDKAREREERSRVLDRFEQRSEFARRRVAAALAIAGVPPEKINGLTWLLDPNVAQVVARIEAGEQVEPYEIRQAFGMGGLS